MSPARRGAAAVFRWNPTARRYLDGRGRFVSRDTVRRGLDVAIAGIGRELEAVARELQAGTISLDTWLLETRALVKDANLAGAALARGGWAQMTPADFGRVGRAVRDQYAYLDRFASDIATGYPMDGRFLARVRLYAKSGRTLSSAIDGEEAAERGATQEENILGPAERHCNGPNGCPAQTARGRVAIGSLVPIGARNCLGNCLCRIRYTDDDGTEI